MKFPFVVRLDPTSPIEVTFRKGIPPQEFARQLWAWALFTQARFIASGFGEFGFFSGARKIWTIRVLERSESELKVLKELVAQHTCAHDHVLRDFLWIMATERPRDMSVIFALLSRPRRHWVWNLPGLRWIKHEGMTEEYMKITEIFMETWDYPVWGEED